MCTRWSPYGHQVAAFALRVLVTFRGEGGGRESECVTERRYHRVLCTGSSEATIGQAALLAPSLSLSLSLSQTHTHRRK